MINPLLFSPSPRDIPAVLKLWDDLQYDHLVEKYKKPLDAYQSAKKYFLKHEEYTHLVVCPDDLEVTRDALRILTDDIKLLDYPPVIAGMCNMDENQPEVYNIQDTGISYADNKPPAGKNSWMRRKDLPKDVIFQVGFAGFACEFINREVMELVSFVGATTDGQGNMDWAFTKECSMLDVPILVDKRVNLWHRRIEQYKEVKEFRAGRLHAGEEAEFIIKGKKN